MANDSKDLIKMGKKVRQFREENAYSLQNFATITGVSVSSLSRIENAGQYSKALLNKVCAIMGITSEDLLTTDVRKISKKEIDNRVRRQYLRLGLKKDKVNEINKTRETFHGPSYLVRQTIQLGFLDQFRLVGEVRDFIHNEFGVILISSSITNALNRLNCIIVKPSGIGKYNYYKIDRRKINK